MADLRDVMNAIEAICTNALYPNGSTSSTPSPVNGAITPLKTGWPISSELTAAMTAGSVVVSIYASGNSRNTTRFIDGWQPYGTITTGAGGNAPTQLAMREIRRITREIQITTWASTPNARDTTGAALDAALALIDRLPLADGSTGQMKFSRDAITDASDKDNTYARHLFYWVEYGTFQSQTDYIVETIIANVDGGVSPPDAPIKTITVTAGT